MKRPDNIDPDWLALEFEVKREQAGWRADIFISNRIPRLSRTRVKQILERSGYDSAGNRIKPNKSLREGEKIIIYRPPPAEPEVPRYFSVLYEDEWILAANKPPGLPVHPTARYHSNTMTALLRECYGDNAPALAHRIDSETSGVLLCAKTKEAERKLKLMFANREIRKTYMAIVFGTPSQDEGRIEIPLCPDTEGPVKVKMACRQDGLPALTEYRVVKKGVEFSLLECMPRTGRQHQIRAHLSHIGYPIVGDKMYGPDKELFLDYIEEGLSPEILVRAGASRHFLHAASLSLIHPITELPLHINCPLPEDMENKLREMLKE